MTDVLDDRRRQRRPHPGPDGAPPAFGRATLAFTGRFEPDSFRAFALHRAARLALDLVAIEAAADRVAATVAGPAALIDAFEMACSLGPIDCLVVAVTREDGG